MLAKFIIRHRLFQTTLGMSVFHIWIGLDDLVYNGFQRKIVAKECQLTDHVIVCYAADDDQGSSPPLGVRFQGIKL